MNGDLHTSTRAVAWHAGNLQAALAELAHRPTEERAHFALMALQDAREAIQELVRDLVGEARMP